MNRNISLASRDPLPLGREDIYKGMEKIGAYLDVTPRDFQEIYAHAYKIARGRLLSSITAGDIMHVPVLCVAEEQSVRDLVIFLDDHRISGADLEAPVGSIMTRECVSVGEGTHLGDMLELLRTRRINRIPVVDAGMRPVGIVSRTDIINAFGVMQ